MRRAVVLAIGTAALLGCPKPPPGPPDVGVAELDAGAVDAGAVDAGIVDAGVPELVVSGTIEIADGGTEVLPSGPSAEVPPLSGLTLHANVELKDFRVRVIDSADQVVPSDDESHVGDGGTDYMIKLAHPLKPAKTYHLQIDAQSGDQVADRTGRVFQDYELVLKTTGEPEPTPGKKPKKKKK